MACRACEPHVFVSVAYGSVGNVFLSSIIYFSTIVCSVWFRMGAVLIPVVVFCRAFTLTAAVTAMGYSGNMEHWRIALQCGVPALFQLFGMLYLGTMMLSVAVNGLKSCPKEEDIRAMKKAFIIAGISMLMSVLSACLVY